MYRQYGRDVSALSSSPRDPVLAVRAVTESSTGCFVVLAVFDENPLLAFPTESEGIDVVAVLRDRGGFWKVTALTRSVPGADGRIDCATT